MGNPKNARIVPIFDQIVPVKIKYNADICKKIIKLNPLKPFIMKIKKILILSIFIICAQQIMAQSPEDAIHNLLQKDRSISPQFIKGMIEVGHYLNCDPWDSSKPCTDICDPWSDKPCNEQLKSVKVGKGKVKKVVAPKQNDAFKQKQMIRIMKHFESKLLKGAGGKVITKKQVKIALQKFPSYKIEAMKKRYMQYAQWKNKQWPNKWQ